MLSVTALILEVIGSEIAAVLNGISRKIKAGSGSCMGQSPATMLAQPTANAMPAYPQSFYSIPPPGMYGMPSWDGAQPVMPPCASSQTSSYTSYNQQASAKPLNTLKQMDNPNAPPAQS